MSLLKLNVRTIYQNVPHGQPEPVDRAPAGGAEDGDYQQCGINHCVHNHPSGSPESSNEDLKVTKRLKAVGLDWEEVIDFFVLSELFKELSESFLYETMIVNDESGNVWVGAVAFYPDTSERCLQVVTEIDKLILRNSLLKGVKNFRQKN